LREISAFAFSEEKSCQENKKLRDINEDAKKLNIEDGSDGVRLANFSARPFDFGRWVFLRVCLRAFAASPRFGTAVGCGLSS
jgi:hypothetical protein